MNTPNYANRTLAAKSVRTYLLNNPGKTSAEIKEATGNGTSQVQAMGLAYWKRNEAGVAVWFAKPGIAYDRRRQEEV